MKNFISSSCLLLTFFLSLGDTYKILVVVPTPGRSHYNLCKAIADILHHKGHEVTLLSSFEPKNATYREIAVPEMIKFKTVDFEMAKQSKINTIKMLNTWLPQMLEALFKSDNVKKFLSNPSEQFDLIILEYFMNEALLGFGVKYNCPVIAMSPVTLLSWLAAETGNPLAPATVPNVFTPFTKNMDLWQRTANTLSHVFQQFMGWLIIKPRQELLYQTLFPEEAARYPFNKLHDKIGAIFINSHPVIGVARPLLPNSIDVGGYHIDGVPSLPKDLQTLMDNAKDGVVLFSMGGNLQSKMMPESTKRAILDALGSVKQLVLWKFEEDLPNKPSNVIIRSWLPQVSILAHPNTKLFISHAGFVSCTETGYFGVPLLAIPIYGDQHHNIATIMEKGYGLKVDYDTLTKESLLSPLQEMLMNPKYEQKAKEIKRLFHDRPIPPRELVAFYAEHVIRTNGAKHLSQPILKFYQQYLLDVLIVILLPIIILVLFLYKIIQKCCKKFSGCDKKDGKMKKQ